MPGLWPHTQVEVLSIFFTFVLPSKSLLLLCFIRHKGGPTLQMFLRERKMVQQEKSDNMKYPQPSKSRTNIFGKVF